MMSLKEIRKFYPSELHKFPRFLLREYLQYKILEIIFESKFHNKLCFLGGTCLRIVHNNQRFSEDLDFDNLSLEEKDFDSLTSYIQLQLQREGYEVAFKTVKKGAWHCYIKFPGLLYDQELSKHKEEKILIQLDTEAQNINYEPDRFILNKFDVFTTLLSSPLSLLMAQKLYAVLNRPRNKGRDFYDLVFLMSKSIKPDYIYIQDKLGLDDPDVLKEKLLEKCQDLDMEGMAKDVQPFLFNPREVKKVRQFNSVVAQYSF